MSLFFRAKIHLLMGMLLLGISAHALAAPNVVVTLKPIHSLVMAVMEGVSIPTLLLPDGASPHIFQLKPSTFKQLHQADIVIWVGPALESFMIKALEQKHPALDLITLQSIPDLRLLPPRHGREWEHTHTHLHKHEHSHEQIDPHFWLSTDNAIVMVDYIAHCLAKIDAIHASQYFANANRVKQQIQILKGTLQRLLQPVQTQPFLVYHDGYQYFEREFHLNGVGTMIINPHLPLSAHGLKTIQDLIAAKKITCVFRETEFNDTIIYNSLKKLDVKVAELDPLGARIPMGTRNYENTMLEIGKTMAECLK